MMKKMILKFLGKDYWSRPVYQDETGRLFKDVNCDQAPIELCTVCGDFEGEPDTPITAIDRYRGVEIVIVGRENEPDEEEKRNYRMLDRLKGDCEYFLGNGNRCLKNLYYGDVENQIKVMKEIYNALKIKPEWLTFEEILNYEKEMLIQGSINEK